MKLSLAEIDRRNSKVRLPELDGSTFAEWDAWVITRPDGSEVRLTDATWTDIDWLHESQLRHLERLKKFGVVSRHDDSER